MTAPVKIGDLVPQSHGGALRRGNPGNAGGSGRPPKVVQAASRALYDSVLAKLAARLEQELDVPELVSVGSMAGRYAGLGSDASDGNAPLLSAEARKARLASILMTLSPADRERVLLGTSLQLPQPVVTARVTLIEEAGDGATDGAA